MIIQAWPENWWAFWGNVSRCVKINELCSQVWHTESGWIHNFPTKMTFGTCKYIFPFNNHRTFPFLGHVQYRFYSAPNPLFITELLKFENCLAKAKDVCVESIWNVLSSGELGALLQGAQTNWSFTADILAEIAALGLRPVLCLSYTSLP